MTHHKDPDDQAWGEKPADEDQTTDEVEEDLPFLPDPAFLRKRMAVEAMHEAGQFIDPDDFDVD